MKKLFLYIIAAGIVFNIMTQLTGCANIVPPVGGPRDSLPPVLIKAVPVDSARGFTGNKITLTFDEYVEIQDLQNNLSVSPTPKNNPIVEAKLRNVTIKLKDTLEKNTTYAISLGNAIRDVREGNMLKNFTYVFSTGNVIDSGTLSGKVLLAETGRPDSTLIAMLYASPDDSSVINMRPRYYTRLDSSGRFRFRFLVPGKYYLYALKDESGTKRYLSKSQLFAFAKGPVIVSDTSTSALLYAYNIREEPRQKKPAPSGTAKPKKDDDRRLRFQTNLQDDQLDILKDFTLTFNDPLKKFDTGKVLLTDDKFTPLTGYTIAPDSTNTVYTFKYPWKAATSYQLILDKEFASDSADRKLFKTDTLSIKAKPESAYGSIKLRFSNLDLSKNPVLQLVQEQKVVFVHHLTGPIFFTKLFQPGEYEIRILYDLNGNGVWDPGDFFGKHLQPEIVVAVPKKLTVKANWDNEVGIEL